MKKRINCKQVAEIELQFDDDKTLALKFDMRAIYSLTELDGGLEGFVADSRIPEQCAKIIYIGAKALNEEFTLEESRAIVSELNPITITEIINEFTDSMGISKNEVQSELLKKLTKQLANQTEK